MRAVQYLLRTLCCAFVVVLVTIGGARAQTFEESLALFAEDNFGRTEAAVNGVAASGNDTMTTISVWMVFQPVMVIDH